MKKILVVLVCLFISVGCSSNNEVFNCDENKYEKNPIASIEFENIGVIEYELFINQAPQSTANFIELANSKFYDGLNMHRLDQPLGVVQGGESLTTPLDYAIKGEFLDNGHCNGKLNEYGTIAMARTQEMDSASSQFYLNFKNNTANFQAGYAVFGKIISGENVLDKFSEMKTKEEGGINAPVDKIIIKQIRVETFDQEMPEVNKIK